MSIDPVLLQIRVVDVAVAPFGLAGRSGFERFDNGVAGGFEVLAGVLADRAIAAANVAANETLPELDRMSAFFDAVLTSVAIGRNLLDLILMSTSGFGHELPRELITFVIIARL